MAIWEFDEFDYDELIEIQNAIDILEGFGLSQDEDMMRELSNQISIKG
jgi:hypothetical protein